MFARCVLCAAEFTEAEIDSQPEESWGACPKCGTKSPPCSPDDDVEVKVNWHELRLLCMWAENWGLKLKTDGQSSPDVVYAICSRIKAQHPERTALTLLDEFRAVRKAFPEGRVETTHPYDDGGI